jgi:hypothetical protein
MKHSFYAIPAAVCLAAAVVTAQAQQPTTPRPSDPPSAQPARPAEPSSQQPARPAEPSSMASANTVTYTGCIKPGTTSGTWVLENAEAAAKPGASGTVGTSGTAKSTTLDLEPAATASGVNLKAHANHKVELVGTVSPAKGSASASPSSTPGAATAQTAHQQFSVQSLKMVSATCP